ncbi:MAG: Calvin cycle protein CP12 [Hormoscilla sp. SP5CHS1]|nr:Calvin cycle protein CP12 [Hormoscilla sp. SP12CHS1]MBC6452436.1 Calvin cycle protein CP12 [Hormoscilla sp. SP5CHS1]MBC6475596.1 Calvin cycle protein CP12 [Hormoscilla sp. GM102CHS1]MBO1346626.1 Calvin cycle protein CP12 [Hormoscilla sp. GUM202]
MTTLQEKIEQEREQARAVCDTKGATSPECAAAYDALEEMQAEASHQKEISGKTNFDKYCDEDPGAAECRIYED